MSKIVPKSSDHHVLIARELHLNLDQGFLAIRGAWTDDRLGPTQVLTVVRALIEDVRGYVVDVVDKAARELIESRTNELQRWTDLHAAEIERRRFAKVEPSAKKDRERIRT